MINFLLLLAISIMQIQNGCRAADLGLKDIGSWAGPLPNASTPNEVTWKLTIYSSETRPDMLAAYLIIKRSSTLRSKVAARPLALPGKKNGEWMEFQFPNTEDSFKARILANELEIIKRIDGKEEKFSLPHADRGEDLVIYGEICQEWKQSLKDGAWSKNLWHQ